MFRHGNFPQHLARNNGQHRKSFQLRKTAVIARRSPADLALPPPACLYTKRRLQRGELHVSFQELMFWRSGVLANKYRDTGTSHRHFQNPPCLSLSISHISLPLTQGKKLQHDVDRPHPPSIRDGGDNHEMNNTALLPNANSTTRQILPFSLHASMLPRYCAKLRSFHTTLKRL